MTPITSHRRWRGLGQLITDVATLFLIGFVSLLVLFLIGGESGSGLDPYYREVARNCLSITKLLKYIFLTGMYAAFLEIVLRLIQYVSQERLGKVAGVSIAAAIYGLTHLKFHLSGAIYAGILGFGTACFFYRTGRWKSLVFWHVCWELVAIGFVIGNAMFVESHCRHVAVHEYKSSQIAEGNLFFVDQWGWADRQHMPSEKIVALRKNLLEDRGHSVRHMTTHVAVDVWHRSKRLDYVYQITVPANATESEYHAVAAFVIWDAAVRFETYQSQQSVLVGTRLSAFAVEDMSSTLLIAYTLQPDQHSPVIIPKHQLAQNSRYALQRWRDEGLTLVEKKIVHLNDFQPRGEAVQRDLKSFIDRMKRTARWVKLVPPSLGS